FFVDEIVHLLVAEGAPERWDATVARRLPVPQGVREAIRRRLAPLPAPCKDALTLASVVGREFGLAALQRAGGLGADALLEVRRRRSPTAPVPRGTLTRPWRTRTRRSCSSARSRSSRKPIRPTRASAPSFCSRVAAPSGRPAMGPGRARRFDRPPTSRDGSETRGSWPVARSASPGRARVCSG